MCHEVEFAKHPLAMRAKQAEVDVRRNVRFDQLLDRCKLVGSRLLCLVRELTSLFLVACEQIAYGSVFHWDQVRVQGGVDERAELPLALDLI